MGTNTSDYLLTSPDAYCVYVPKDIRDAVREINEVPPKHPVHTKQLDLLQRTLIEFVGR